MKDWIGEGWDVPEDVATWSDFHWWKVTGNRLLELVVLSEKPLWYVGHFVKGRMQPCYREGCRHCHDGIGVQMRYILAAAECSSHRVGLLEVGRGVALQIQDWAGQRGRARGMWIEVTKHSHSKNSRMEVQLIDRCAGGWYEDLKVPDVAKALVATWEKQGIEVPPWAYRAVKSFSP